jgi:ketosteroid isomerase-like protein
MTKNRVTRVTHHATWAICAFLLTGCSAASVDTRSDEQTLRALDAEWVKASQARSVDRWVAFYSDDAVVLPANEPMATDKAGIRKSISGLLGLPAVNLSWQPTKIEIAQAGDFAHVYGTYQMSFEESPGKRTDDRGKFVEIWKKQNGSWKCIVDTWNSDLPATPPAPPSPGK